jgi:hypothetical protein
MPLEPAQQAGAVRQLRKQQWAILAQPAVKRPITHAFDGKQKGHCHNFARVEHRLRMLGYVAQGIIYSTKQLGDKIRYCPSFSLMDFIRQGKQGLDL